MEGARGAPRRCSGPIRSALGEGGLGVAGGVRAAAVWEERRKVRGCRASLTGARVSRPVPPARPRPRPRSPGLQQMPAAAQRPPLPHGFWPDWQGDGR